VESSLDWLERLVLLEDREIGTSTLEAYEDLATVRSTARFDELMDRATQIALDQNEAKSIWLQEGYTQAIELQGDEDVPEVNLSLQYDSRSLTIQAEVTDADVQDGERSWRYGDGFMINFVFPDNLDDPYSDRFYGYGFSMEHGGPVAVLVGRHGTYFLSSRPIPPTIQVDTATNTTTYVIRIPWLSLDPFHPLMDETAGINIRYTSKNEDGSRSRVGYLRDAEFDSELTPLRRYAPLHFTPSDVSPFQMTGALETRLVSGGSVTVSLAIWTPEARSAGLRIVVQDPSGSPVSEVRFDQDLPAGKSLLHREVELPQTAGSYRLTVSVDDALTWKETFYQYDQEEFLRLQEGIRGAAGSSMEPISEHSLDALAYRLEVLENAIEGFTRFDEPDEVRQKLDDLADLYDTFLENGSIYVESGYLLSAFLSPLDSTLQPFSIYLPGDFDPAASYHLVVALHGSGVDEVGFLHEAARTFAGQGMIILGPRGRGLSDFYTGPTEDDVVHIVQLIQGLFDVDKTFCYGFSMGGYGSWRLGFLHPELFDGAIVVSGVPYNARQNTPENDMRNRIGQALELPFLVIHGTDDPVLPIETTDEFIAQLQEAGYDVVYRRIPGGGHADFGVGRAVQMWLSENLGVER
jgi:predicted esterase